jgi:hypothetical protein
MTPAISERVSGRATAQVVRWTVGKSQFDGPGGWTYL